MNVPGNGRSRPGLLARHERTRFQRGQSGPRDQRIFGTFIHTRKGVFSEDGVNKASIQFGTGAAKTLNSGFESFTLNNQTFIRADDTGFSCGCA